MFTVTFSGGFDGDFQKQMRETLEKKTRALIKERLTFPGSENLKIKATVKDDSVSLAFDGPPEICAEAKRRWESKRR